ncbi:GAP family protein [Streptomyces dangxiongensis]|uniref:GAP family protein n=2 Tax=Streptomyces dangxiongensis TaxID=1442032 RepID=A0A3G2J7R5_9ACTN|nr:GAP family protein [Streptomyces dangxiongensis]AYN38290.1 GAP family protein [Streptomyces dangxiongensis]
MVPDLLLIALAIALDPLPVMSFVLVLGSARGVWKGLVFILSWLACLVVVIVLVLAVTGGQPPAPRSPPSTAVLAAKLLIGVLLIVYGGHRHRRAIAAARDRGAGPGPGTGGGTDPGVARADGQASSARLTERTDRITAWAAAGLAVLLQPWGLVAAGATTVLEADTSHLSAWFVLFCFCLLATAGLLAVELYVVFSPVRAKVRLLRLRAWLAGHQEQALVTICLVLGCWLMGKSIYQLTG